MLNKDNAKSSICIKNSCLASLKIHHIGYLVDEIKKSTEDFEKLGFTRISKIVTDSLRGAYILFLDNNGYVVELIQPISEVSPIYGLRKKHRNSPYHICYETDDLINNIKAIESSGFAMVIQTPQPAPAILGCPNVAFLMNRHIGMIELVEEKKIKDV